MPKMKAKLKCIIIDDEIDHIEILAGFLKEYPEIESIIKVNDPFQASSRILETEPELIFLDIDMPGKNGFDILDEIKENDKFKGKIIFTTGFNEFAIKAFEYAAFDYVLKPVDPDRLAQSMNRFINSLDNYLTNDFKKLQETLSKKAFKSQSGIIFIDPNELIYARADGNYTDLVMVNGRRETVTLLISKFEKELDSSLFFRSHRSYLINLKKLARINTRKRQCTLIHKDKEFVLEVSKEKIGLLGS